MDRSLAPDLPHAPGDSPAVDVCADLTLPLFPELEPLFGDEAPFQLQAEQVLESMSDRFVFLDREWRYRYINARADEAHLRHGRTHGQLIGRTIWECFPALAESELGRCLRGAAASGRAAECVVRDTVLDSWEECRVVPGPRGIAVYTRDVTERRRVAEEQALLAAAGEALGGSLDPRELLRRAAPLPLPLLGRWCFAFLLDDAGSISALEAACLIPEKVETYREVVRRFPRAASEQHPFVRAARAGRSVLIPEVTEETYAALSDDAEYVALARAMAPTTLLSVPLVARGRTLGALAFATDEVGRRFDARDLALAGELAARVALAFDNALLYRDARLAAARAEEALALLDSLFRGAPIGLAFLDPELRYVAINDALARSNGLPADAHLGRTVEEIIPVFAPIVEPILRRVLETGEPVVDWEWTGASIDRPEETRHWLESFYPVLGDEGRVLGVGVALTEITEIKRAEDVQRFLAETSRLVAPMLDRAGWLEQLPRSALPRLGDYCVLDLADEAGEVRATVLAHVDPEKEALAREFRRLFPLDARKSDFAVLRVLRTGEPVIALEVPAGYVDETVDDEASRALLRQLAPNTFLVLPLSARGRVLGTMSFVMSEPGRRHTPRDVALAEELVRRIAMAIDNARLYEAERRARAEAEAANRAKFDFLTTMSHELRTPLNAIAGYVELLELGIHGPVTEAQTDALRRIQRNQRHLLGLINDVLNFARLETGSLPLRLEAVDVGEALAGLEPLVAPQLAARALRYACDSPPAPLAARADPERMQQVLLNLLSNAVKFTEPGGRVRVEAARGEDGRTVEIRVRDTGIGIPPEKREEVFEPFVQLDRGLTRTTEGTGLGLAISRDLARAMGGDLVAGENPGGGAVFTLTLPFA